MYVQTKKGLVVTHNHHVEIAVDLCIILLNLVLNLTKSQLLFTPLDLFILKKRRASTVQQIGRIVSAVNLSSQMNLEGEEKVTERRQMGIKVKLIQALCL